MQNPDQVRWSLEHLWNSEVLKTASRSFLNVIPWFTDSYVRILSSWLWSLLTNYPRNRISWGWFVFPLPSMYQHRYFVSPMNSKQRFLQDTIFPPVWDTSEIEINSGLKWLLTSFASNHLFLFRWNENCLDTNVWGECFTVIPVNDIDWLGMVRAFQVERTGKSEISKPSEWDCHFCGANPMFGTMGSAMSY